MKISLWILASIILITAIAMAGCSLPAGTPPPNVSIATVVAATLSVMQTNASIPPTAPPVIATFTPPPTIPNTPMVVPTPQNPLVTADALCWAGPGNVYEVVSAIKKGTRVELIGRGSIAGWWIVRNPRYHDPCWVQQGYLQIDLGYDLSRLQIYYPPPTPTLTPTP